MTSIEILSEFQPMCNGRGVFFQEAYYFCCSNIKELKLKLCAENAEQGETEEYLTGLGNALNVQRKACEALARLKGLTSPQIDGGGFFVGKKILGV